VYCPPCTGISRAGALTVADHDQIREHSGGDGDVLRLCGRTAAGHPAGHLVRYLVSIAVSSFSNDVTSMGVGDAIRRWTRDSIAATTSLAAV